MKTKKILFYMLAVLLGGCVPSLHPLYTETDIVFDEKLLGAWAEDEDLWVFQKDSEPNCYKLTINEKDKKGEFNAHLVKIDKMQFLDLFPKEPELQASDFYKFHLLPIHTFIKVEQTEPTLKMRVMDPDALKNMLEADPNLIKHEVLEDPYSIVLTASTKELQTFMKKHADDKGLFGEPAELKRPELKEPNEPPVPESNEAPKTIDKGKK